MALLRRRPSALVVGAGACLLLALASLLLPSGPTYDPYSWLIWGRDLAHLELSTTGTGTSWKPFPALVDTPLSLLGGAAAPAWLALARAGALFAVVMVFRLAWRLAPNRGRLLAGVLAAAILVLTREWVQRNGMGNAEGLMVAFGLLAIDRHLDGHRVQAFALLATAALIRIEAAPFVLAYGVWLWSRDRTRGARAGVAAGVLAIPLLWFGGDWLGSGRLTTGAKLALHRQAHSPAAAAHPAAALLSEALGMVPWPAWIALGLAVVWGALRRDRVVLVLTAWALVWTALVAAMVTRGFAGTPRFLDMPVAIEAVLAGVGAALLVTHSRKLAPLVTAIVIAGFAWGSVHAARQLSYGANDIEHIADLDTGIARTVQEAGGPAVMRCGPPTTTWYAVSAVAWDLGVPADDVRWRYGAPLLEACSRRFVPAERA